MSLGVRGPRGYPIAKCLFSYIYDFRPLQTLHSKRVAGKFIQSKGLRVNVENPGRFRGFFSAFFIIAVGVKLIRHVNVLDWRGFSWFGGLTGFSVGSAGLGLIVDWDDDCVVVRGMTFSGQEQKQIPFGDDKKGAKAKARQGKGKGKEMCVG
jgi:hypothetical protein